MNALCYKIVFSKRLGALVAVGEHTAGQGKAAGTGVRTAVYPSSAVGATAGEFVGSLKAVFASVALTCFTATSIAAGPAANTLPTGAQVTTGNVAISTNGATMNILQSTDKASVNWNSFSIGSGAAVNVHQNSASSVLLNRVVGNDPSQIFGKLTANGQVILINPNGVVFGKGGSVTASTFTASTFGMTDADFQNGKYKFNRNGSTAGVTVENGADIHTATPGGYVALIGASVNNQGEIHTQQGAVVMAAGESVALPTALTDSVGVPLSSKVRLELAPSTINASVENGGTITTDGGQVLMQASAVVDAVSHVANASVTHTGTIDTTGEQAGAVTLQADHGNIKATGSIKANSTNTANHGGDIIIGRDPETGVLAQSTDVSGATLESKRGFIETSGVTLLSENVQVKAAQWLLDPYDIEITDSANDLTSGYTTKVTIQTLQAALNNGTDVTIQTTAATGPATGVEVATTGNSAGTGNILVTSAITKTANTSSGSSDPDASLTLIADKNITIKNVISSTSGKLDVTLKAGQSVAGGTLTIDSTGSITANGGNVTLQTNGGAISSASTNGIKGNNIAIDTTGSTNISADLATIEDGGKKTGGSTAITISGVGGVVAVNNFTARGVSNSASGLAIRGSTIKAKNISVNAKTTTAPVAINITNSTIQITDNGKGTLTGESAANVATLRAATMIQETSNFIAGNNATLTVEGNATAEMASFRANTRGLRIDDNAKVTTDGNVTLKGTSKNSDGVLLIQSGGGFVRVNSGTLTIDGTTQGNGGGQTNGILVAHPVTVNDGAKLVLNGVADNKAATQAENGVQISGSITGTGTAALVVNGTAKSAANSSGIAINGPITGFQNISMLGARPAASSGNAVLINHNLSATGNILIQANGGQITQSNRTTLSSTNGWITIDNSNSQNIDSATGKINEKGAATAQVNAITLSGGVSAGNNNGTDKKDLNIYGQGSAAGVVIASGSLSASGNVNITGEGVNERGVLTYESIANVKPTIEAKNGDVSITGKSTTQTAISLESAEGLVKAKNNIVLAGDKQNLSTLINAGSSVKLQTATPGRSITLGADDGSAQLGISQAELTKITANKLIIGRSTDGGSINVASAIDVKHIDTLSLQTQSTNTVTQTNSGSIRGNKVEIVSGNVTLNNAANNITTLAAKAATLNFVNNAALTIGEVNGTKGITTTGGSSVITRTGNLTINENVSNNMAGDVILGAGTDASANEGLDSNIKVGNTAAKVSNTNTGKTFFYTGSTSDTDKLEDLNSSLANLDLSAINGGMQNADSNVTFKTGDTRNTITGGADVQVMFREKIAIGSLTGVEVERTYGDANTQNTTPDQLLAYTKTQWKNSVSNTASVVTEKAAGTIRIANTALIDALDNPSLSSPAYSASGYLNAKDDAYKYNTLNSSKYDTRVTGLAVKVIPKTLTLLGTTVADKAFDGNTSATVTNNGTLNGLVGNETLNVTATGTFNNSSIGNQKPVVITGTLANGTGLASNYRVAPASAVANITEAVKPPVPVVPTDGNSRVKVPVGSANPFALASAEDLADDTCSANSIENCYCEPSELNKQVDICYEPKAGAKGSAR